MNTIKNINLNINYLLQGYKEGRFTPAQVLTEVHRRASSEDLRTIWIYLLDIKEILSFAQNLEKVSQKTKPLYGIPFAVKDNIDLANVPTTAGCPDFSRVPRQHAFAVKLLIEAGAIPIGKTNLDQFATGLVGVRSPYGTPPNKYDQNYIPGGSSSGSAAAVAHDLVSFSLGTDTAGSGRVPAAFNNLVGWKPTKGLISTSGVLPACRTLDCVSVFTKTVNEVRHIFPVLSKQDLNDPYSKKFQPQTPESETVRTFSAPQKELLKFFGNQEYEKLFLHSIEKMESLGYKFIETNMEDFFHAAELLYGGPWISERFLVLEDFIEKNRDAIWPVTYEIISQGKEYSALDYFKAEYKLNGFRKAISRIWEKVDFLLLPTAGTIYTLQELHENPKKLNTNLGYYTNFVNLLDLSALALPAGFTSSGLPFGITLCAPAFHDQILLNTGDRWTDNTKDRFVEIAVCGAHMRGLPLNYQLLERKGLFVGDAKTAPEYRFYRLRSTPPKPGLLHVKESGSSIELEIWKLPESELGGFLDAIPAPLGLGKVLLDDGRHVTGFLMESIAAAFSEDISHLGNWRNALKRH